MQMQMQLSDESEKSELNCTVTGLPMQSDWQELVE